MVKAVEDLGDLDNTLIMYLVGDNGASAEGGMNGMFNEMTYFNGVEEKVPDMLKSMDKWGGPETFPHMAAGWAVAGSTPFMWTKQVASNFGGTRNPLVVHWPKGIKAKGEVRSQFQHVTDMAPTVLEAAGIPEPRTVDGVAQTPMEGVSMMYTFDDPKAAGRHTTQYFEILGNRAIYHDGWVAGTVHSAPWDAQPRHKLSEDVWELYNVDEDFSEATDLSASNPEKLKEMQALFMAEAEKYRVLPIDDRRLERFDPAVAGRPDLMAGRKSLTVYEGMTGMMENAFINVKNQSFTITADVDIPAGGAPNGVILAQGGRFGGWSLYVKDGKPAFTYNFVGLQAIHRQRRREALPRQGDDEARLRLRRQRPRQGRDRDALHQRQEGRLRTRRADQRQRLLRGRRGRRGCGRRDQRQLGVQAARQQVHRQNREGHGGRQMRITRADGTGESRRRIGDMTESSTRDRPA